MEARKTLLVYTWDGQSKPLGLVEHDANPDFDLLLFDYSGKADAVDGIALLSVQTECKGEIYREVFKWLGNATETYEYVGLLDDDIEVSWSAVNRLIAIARAHRLDSFIASLSSDSYYSHRHFLHRGGPALRAVPWVEVMMPFYRTELFMAGGSYYATSISSYGLDQFAMATLQKLLGYERVAIIDAIVFRHRRPITSDNKIFANGLNAQQERSAVRRKAMAQVASEQPDLLGSRWYLRTFAPWDGPARYWPLRLLTVWLKLRSWQRRPVDVANVPKGSIVPPGQRANFGNTGAP